MYSSLFRLALLLLTVWEFTGCGTVGDLVTSNLPTLHEGKASIAVKLREQKAYLYRGGAKVAGARISTGREGYETPAGRFKVISKDRDHRSGLYGDYVDRDGRIVKANVDVRKDPKPPGARYVGAPMPYYVEFRPSYGLHAGHLPDYPASHGCVRLSYWKARQFYHAARIGTSVVVTR
ncbi:MAG: L,D-transpeptidase family protein [Verrucomicrobiota bacterium]|nr:L,D-transpeptidase family protein [Verrucomicrobiota bacterium]